MKPLNHKERNDKFWSFVIVGTISLVMVVFCFYFTNDFLLGAVAGNREQQFNRFLQYQKYQRQYIRQLEGINKSLSEDGLQTDSLISGFKTSFRKNDDTSALMNKIVELANNDAVLISRKNQAEQEVLKLEAKLKLCNKMLETAANP